jgi:hypothetical protein
MVTSGTHFSAIDGAVHSSRNFPQTTTLLLGHFRNPSASSDTDTTLSLAQSNLTSKTIKLRIRNSMAVYLESRTENIQNSRSYQAL